MPIAQDPLARLRALEAACAELLARVQELEKHAPAKPAEVK